MGIYKYGMTPSSRKAEREDTGMRTYVKKAVEALFADQGMKFDPMYKLPTHNTVSTELVDWDRVDAALATLDVPDRDGFTKLELLCFGDADEDIARIVGEGGEEVEYASFAVESLFMEIGG